MFKIETHLKDIALPLRIDFDDSITGPWLNIHILMFCFIWTPRDNNYR